MFENTETRSAYKKPSLNTGSERHELSLGLFRVGRDPQNNLVLQDAALSRHHFAIDIQTHQAQLIDLGSANGTLVNKKRVRSAWLKDGDKIKIGEQVLHFEAPGFILSHAIFDENEQTHSRGLSRTAQISWLALWALLISGTSLFFQLTNRERQKEQDQLLSLMHQKLLEPKVVNVSKPPSESPEKKWQQAVLDFRSGDEDHACETIKALIPNLKPSDLLHTKAQSFLKRKCVLE